MGAQTSSPTAASKPVTQAEGKPRFWYRDGFFLTNDKSYLDPHVVNEAFDSDLMWWNDPLELPLMHKMLDSCMTFGVYAVNKTEDQLKTQGAPPPQKPSYKMAGFARVVTDYTTFAYLTDVFVLEAYQRRGLASWMMRAVKEIISDWPKLRGLILMTSDRAAARMYERELGVVDFSKGPSAGLVLLELGGAGKKDVPETADDSI